MTIAPPNTNPPPRTTRRWLQFSLRTLLIVVTIIAVGMGLLMRYVHQQREIVRLEKEAVTEIKKLHGYVFLADQTRSIVPKLPTWLRKIFGDEEYRPVISVTLSNNSLTTDAVLVHIEKMTAVKYLNLNKTAITDAGLKYISKLSTLQELNLSNTIISDVGLLNLSELKSLQRLHLSNTLISDVGIGYLNNLKALKIIELNNTQITSASLSIMSKLNSLEIIELNKTKITDADLEYLCKLNALRILWLSETSITDSELEKLKTALPNCAIRWSPPEKTNQ